jgi:hypothetical protein
MQGLEQIHRLCVEGTGKCSSKRTNKLISFLEASFTLVLLPLLKRVGTAVDVLTAYMAYGRYQRN